MAFPQSTSAGGMKLEAVMEQLQRQQQARLEMERKERKFREAHIMYAQQVAAQQAILAAARASGASFMGKSLVGGVPVAGLPPRVSNQSSVDSEREDDEDRGRDSADEDDDNEMMEGDEGSEEDEGGASGLEFLRKQTLALQQNASRVPARPYSSYSASAPQRASPPIRVKQEPNEGMSPAGPHSATSPNGQGDWGFDDHFRQVSARRSASSSAVPPPRHICSLHICSLPGSLFPFPRAAVTCLIGQLSLEPFPRCSGRAVLGLFLCRLFLAERRLLLAAI